LKYERIRMGRMRTRSKDVKAAELLPEYDLGNLLKGVVQGKYADRYREGTNLVLLAPDVALAFPTGEVVNEALRLVIRLRELPGTAKKTAAKE
jgi:hypothetical protein